MRARIAPLGVVFLLFATLTPAQDAKKDLEALQGEWTLVSTEPKLEPEEAYKLTIKGEQWTIRAPSILGNAAAKTTIKIDPSKSPKTLDLTIRIGDRELPPRLGIYKLEGNTLTVCQTIGKAERPTEFRSTDLAEYRSTGKGYMLTVFRRTVK